MMLWMGPGVKEALRERQRRGRAGFEKQKKSCDVWVWATDRWWWYGSKSITTTMVGMRDTATLTLPAKLGNDCRRCGSMLVLGVISHALLYSVPIDFPRLISKTEHSDITRPQSMKSATNMEQLQRKVLRSIRRVSTAWIRLEIFDRVFTIEREWEWAVMITSLLKKR
jgi:ribosomal protein L37E